ncbi:hypothetical protein GRI38_11655 [Altererythrobacter aurantiacus]|uniref:Uncharacterized protein n=1 Tax=Parapontixanthobacter aurantiacus TaxID=1463599 RepID=A0A844ZI67_9SPHN|nr:hypothetical protein [Parapontixanthobacter aurantiacus]MXO86680.1 hypothetical protein [Parapontixanthobacter aurantiacus]
MRLSTYLLAAPLLATSALTAAQPAEGETAIVVTAKAPKGLDDKQLRQWEKLNNEARKLSERREKLREELADDEHDVEEAEEDFEDARDKLEDEREDMARTVKDIAELERDVQRLLMRRAELRGN